MKKISKFLFREIGVAKRTFFWNMVANMLYSLQSPILLLIVARYSTGDLSDAGYFSIIYATTHMLAAIGNYNMRYYQVSDVNDEFSFSTYWSSRVISVLIMTTIGTAYGAIYYNVTDKFIIFLCFVLYRLSDSVEDVIHGHVQKMGRLDVASFAKAVRIFVSSCFFALIYIMTADLLMASVFLCVCSAILLTFFTIVIKMEIKALKWTIDLNKVLPLLRACLPVCLSSFLQSYLVNSPKYSIDKVMNPDYQAIFNILFMPLFVINVFSMFLFNPIVAQLGFRWVNKKYALFWKTVIKQIVIVEIFTVFVAICGYVFGCDVLGLMYGVNLDNYKVLLVYLLLAGGLTAIGSFLVVIVTIIRKQNLIVLAYMLTSMISLFGGNCIVKKWGLMGAAGLYGILMAVLAGLLSLIILLEYRRVSYISS